MASIPSSEVESDGDVDCFLEFSSDIAAAVVELKKCVLVTKKFGMQLLVLLNILNTN